MKVEGILIEDPYMSFTPTGKAVTNFKVLVLDGSDLSTSDMVKVVAWEELAEKCNETLRKDFKVRLFGSEKERWWTTPEGEKRSQKEFSIYRVQVLR